MFDFEPIEIFIKNTLVFLQLAGTFVEEGLVESKF